MGGDDKSIDEVLQDAFADTVDDGALSNKTFRLIMTNLMRDVKCGVKALEKIETLESEVQVLRDELADVRTETNDLRFVNAQLNTGLKQVCKVLNSHTMHSYGYNVLVHGVSEKENELDLQSTVLKVMNSLDPAMIPIVPSDLERVHRLGPPRDPSKKKGPRAIVCKFLNRNRRREVMDIALSARPQNGQNKNGSYISSHTPFKKILDLKKIFSSSAEPASSGGDPSSKRSRKNDTLEPEDSPPRKGAGRFGFSSSRSGDRNHDGSEGCIRGGWGSNGRGRNGHGGRARNGNSTMTTRSKDNT